MSEAHVTDALVKRGRGRGRRGRAASHRRRAARTGRSRRGRSLRMGPRDAGGGAGLARQSSRHPSPVTLAGLRGCRGPQRADHGLLPQRVRPYLWWGPFRSSPTALDIVRPAKIDVSSVVRNCVCVFDATIVWRFQCRLFSIGEFSNIGFLIMR